MSIFENVRGLKKALMIHFAKRIDSQSCTRISTKTCPYFDDLFCQKRIVKVVQGSQQRLVPILVPKFTRYLTGVVNQFFVPAGL
jgi:hypothetical protein